jgi:AraC-like DNA-binding protein
MMASSAVRTYTEPDEYAAAMRQGTVGLTVMQRGNFTAKLTRIDLDRLSMQRFSATLGYTSHVGYWGERATIAFQTRPGLNVTRNGQVCAYTSVARLNASQSYYLHAPGPASYATMSLPLNELASLGGVVGHDLTQPKVLLSVAPPPDALARMRRLHEAAGYLAEDAPAVLAHPEGARGLEQALIEAMMDCLGQGEVGEDRAALRQHAAIMRRFHRAVEETPDQALFIPDLCKKIGTSVRTLQICCEEQLGVGPKQYLLLRRMHLVRRDLRESTPTETTVTEIATRYGFWQFGRLAGEYRSLFGELPSATLARPPHH